MFDHGVKYCEQLAHGRDKSDFEDFALSFQALIELANHRISFGGHQGRHVQGIAYRGAATPDKATTSEGTAVTGEGCQSDQGGNLFTAQGSELGQLGQQGAAGDGANAGRGAQQLFGFVEGGVVFDELVEILVSAIEGPLEIVDVCSDFFTDLFGSGGQAVFLGDDHPDELSSAQGQRSELHSDLVGQRSWFGATRLSVVSQYRSIDAVGLGQLSSGFGEVSDLAWVDHHDGDLSTNPSVQDRTFEAAGGLQHDQSRSQLRQSFDQGLDTGFVVGHRQGLSRGTNRNIELRFGHIDTDKDKGISQDENLLDDFNLPQPNSTLRMMRAWITQATVRAFGEAERDDPCSDTISTDLDQNDLSRPVSYLPYDNTNPSK